MKEFVCPIQNDDIPTSGKTVGELMITWPHRHWPSVLTVMKWNSLTRLARNAAIIKAGKWLIPGP